jgi:hypothetical protein
VTLSRSISRSTHSIDKILRLLASRQYRTQLLKRPAGHRIEFEASSILGSSFSVGLRCQEALNRNVADINDDLMLRQGETLIKEI